MSRSIADKACSSAASVTSPRRLVLTVCVVLVAVFAGTDAWAQDERFARTAAALPAVLEGAYGDEGPRVAAALDDLQQGLAEWDRALEDASEILK